MNMTTPTSKQNDTWRQLLLSAYEGQGLWGEFDYSVELTHDLERGSDHHLAYLTLVYAISGGRNPETLWQAARETITEDPELFDPQFLAYAKPQALAERLDIHKLTHKKKADATVWQRTGQAMVMRAKGSVNLFLEEHDFDAQRLMKTLKDHKATFLVLSGDQTAPRWLYGLTQAGEKAIKGAGELPVPVSPAAARALEALRAEGETVPAELFSALDALGRRGCAQRPESALRCPVAAECPVASFCRYAV